MIDRSTTWNLADAQTLRTCSAEDLIVQKAFAGRDQDWVDIRLVITAQPTRLNRALIFQELEPLLELSEDRSALRRLEQLFGA